MDWELLISILKNHNVYIQTHNFPDPDAIASAYGLQEFLKLHGVPTKICFVGKIEKMTTKRMLDLFPLVLASDKDLEDMNINDYIITIDGQKHNSNFTDLPGDEVACIDHHPTNIPCEYQYKDVRIVGACATLITEYFVKSHTEMSKLVATALLYGIHMDTDSFNRGVTKLDIEMFEYLNDLADIDIVRNMRNSVMELEDLRAYGEAIKNIKLYDNIGFAKITFACPEALVAMISDFILGLDVVEISVVYAFQKEGIKFSVRSEVNSVHAGVLVRQSLKGYGDGGGHAVMAGGYIPMKNVNMSVKDFDFMIQSSFINEINRQRGSDSNEEI